MKKRELFLEQTSFFHINKFPFAVQATEVHNVKLPTVRSQAFLSVSSIEHDRHFLGRKRVTAQQLFLLEIRKLLSSVHRLLSGR